MLIWGLAPIWGNTVYTLSLRKICKNMGFHWTSKYGKTWSVKTHNLSYFTQCFTVTYHYYLCIILRADAFALILFKILCYYVLTLASVNFKLKLQGMKIDRSSKIKMTNHKASNALLCAISRVTFLIARLCNVNILSCPMSSSN